jgi:hypothetical protein
MILIREYFGNLSPYNTAHLYAAKAMLQLVNGLLAKAEKRAGIIPPTNPATGTQISGQKWGGYRTAECPIGAPKSAHKTGHAVDIYDPQGILDRWITNELLTECGLYREHPDATDGWCHLTDRAPQSGNRTFHP